MVRRSADNLGQRADATAQALLEAAVQAVLACDRDGRIVLANAAAERMFGYPKKALLGLPLDTLVPEPFRAEHSRRRTAWFDAPRAKHGRKGLELSALRRDGSEFPAEISLSYTHSKKDLLAVAFVSDITERKRNEQTLLECKTKLQKLSGALLSAQETANKNVARELHDVFSQEIAAVALDISSLREMVKGNSAAERMLTDIRVKLGRLSADAHRLSRELHPAILEELGIEPALRQECDFFREKTGIATVLFAAHVPESIPKATALCLYRVAQESLRNVHKHSESPHVRVKLEGNGKALCLKVEDDGDGFELERALKKGGLGLISMEERVRLVDGKLDVRSQPGKGTVVTAVVPIVRTS